MKKFKTEDLVRDRNTRYVGHVRKVYPGWEDVEGITDKEGWFDGLDHKPSTKDQQWYSVLVIGGGSICAPEEYLEVVVPLVVRREYVVYVPKGEVESYRNDPNLVDELIAFEDHVHQEVLRHGG